MDCCHNPGCFGVGHLCTFGVSESAEVGFTEASWSPTLLAEVDATAATSSGVEKQSVEQTAASAFHADAS